MIFLRLSIVLIISINLQCGLSTAPENLTHDNDEGDSRGRNLLGLAGPYTLNHLLGKISVPTLPPKRRIFTQDKSGDRNKDKTYVKVPEKESVQQDEKNITHIDFCNKKYWNIAFQKKVTFTTFNFGLKAKTYLANTDCKVMYQGSRACIPIMDCETPINLRKRVDGTCKDDYLYVTDGLGGGVKFCDNDKIKLMKPSNGGKDFYVRLVTGSTNPVSSFSGFKCSIACQSKKYQATQELRPSKKTKKMHNNCVCGLRTEENVHRIVGGTTAAINEFPWLAAIVLKGTRQPICGGAVINDRHILTAAHCFVLAEVGKDDVEVLLHAHLLDQSFSGDIANVPLGLIKKREFIAIRQKGSIQGIGWNLEAKSDEDENSTRFGVEEVICHPMFNDGYDNDVAIMRLNKKIDINSEYGVTPICLPNHSLQYNDYHSVKGTVAGWGLGHEDAAASNRLLQKLENIPIIDHSKCQKLFNETISDKMLCAGFLEGGKDSCTGDSGGPLIIKESNGQFKQIGIVSWGNGCAKQDNLGIYTDVQEIMEWINFHTTADNNVQWCQETTSVMD